MDIVGRCSDWVGDLLGSITFQFFLSVFFRSRKPRPPRSVIELIHAFTRHSPHVTHLHLVALPVRRLFFRSRQWIVLRAPFPTESFGRSNCFAAYQMNRSSMTSPGGSPGYPGALETTSPFCVPFFVYFAIAPPFFPLGNGTMMREPFPIEYSK